MAIPGLMAVIAIGLMLTGHHVWMVSLLLGLWACWPPRAQPDGGTWIAALRCLTTPKPEAGSWSR